MAENFDQIRTRSPFTTIDGNETIALNQDGVTKAGFLSVLKTWLENTLSLTRERITDSTEFGRDLMALEDVDAFNGLVVPYSPPIEATPEELQDGIIEDSRTLTPKLIADAIAYHSAEELHSIDAALVVGTDDVGSILVCDAPIAIDITIPQLPSLKRGSIQIINLATDAVKVVADDTTLIDGTGTIIEKSIIQYEHTELIYLGNNTWYVREQ